MAETSDMEEVLKINKELMAERNKLLVEIQVLKDKVARLTRRLAHN